VTSNSACNAKVADGILDRARRERDFFNEKNLSIVIPDDALRVPHVLPQIPHEVEQLFPSPAGKVVCEIGCGYGVVSCWFALRGAQVFGIDVADSNVQIAERAARMNGVQGRAKFQVMQAEAMTFPSNALELVFGNAVLHHVDLETTAREVFRVLKPGGTAIFREPLGENRLLEWARRSPLRSAKHRHTQDERSLLYRDAQVFRDVFPQAALRESELLAVTKAIFRRAEGDVITNSPWGKLMGGLSRLDSWLLSFPQIRPFASYCVLSMSKPT